MILLNNLQKEFGEAVEVREAQPTDAVDGVAVGTIAAPRDAEAAASLVNWCGREKVALVVRGCGTKLHLGAPPERCDLIVSTEHLNRIVEHDEGNATIQAEAGITLRALNAALEPHRQFVPLDEDLPGATLGGAIATNYNGAGRLKYHAPRDQVVGLHAVLSDGRTIKAGSKVVKNVSGYDLNKIFIGSYGTLGLITQVTIRLRPHDVASQTLQGSFINLDEAAARAREIASGSFVPTALRIIDDGNGYKLLVRFDGGETAVKLQAERLIAMQLVEPGGLQEPASGDWQVRAVLPIQAAAGWIEKARSQGANSIVWDYVEGIVHAGFSGETDVAALRQAAEQQSGFLFVERAPVERKTPEFVWGKCRANFTLMERLKSSFDEARIFAPGRFVGGL